MKRLKVILRLLFFIVIVIFFNACSDDEIPTLIILKEAKIPWDKKDTCRILFIDKKDTVELEASIKKRGGMSSRYWKHSYAIELNNSFPLANLPEDDDWIINANYIDKTFMRHKINYDLFRQMNSDNIAAQCAYINVKLNDKEKGLYVLMQELNASMIGLDKGDSMAMLFKDPPIFYEKRFSKVKDSTNYYQQKFPKIKVSDKSYFIEAFKDFLFYSTDEEFAKEIANWVDIKNIMDWHLILLFSNNSDGIMKNFYLYKINSTSRFKIAIWDYDHSFGRDGDNEYNLMDRELNCSRSVLIRRLLEIEETNYSSKLKERWFDLRIKNVFSNENMQEMIHSNDRIISKYLDKNFELWPVKSKWYFDSSNYQQEVDLVLDFTSLRLKQLDDYFEQL